MASESTDVPAASSSMTVSFHVPRVNHSQADNMQKRHVIVISILLVSAGCVGITGSETTTTRQKSQHTTGSEMPQFSLSTSIETDVTITVKDVPSNETVLDQTYHLTASEEVQLRDELSHDEYYVTVRLDEKQATWRLEPAEGMMVEIDHSGNITVVSHTYA
jgi:hypothetical protein